MITKLYSTASRRARSEASSSSRRPRINCRMNSAEAMMSWMRCCQVLLCRTNRLREDRVAELGPQGAGRHEVHRLSEQVFQPILEVRQAEQCHPVVDLHEKVHVASRSSLAPRHRAEHGNRRG